MKKHISLLILVLMGMLLVFGTAPKAFSKDPISWTGFIQSIEPPAQGAGGPGGYQQFTEPPKLADAAVSLVNKPGISTISDTTGKFTLSGIPAKQLHWIKVSKTATHITTNIGVQFGDTDIDNTVQTQGLTCGQPPLPPCDFGEKLFAVSKTVQTTFEDPLKPGANFDPTRGMVVLKIEGEMGMPVLLDFSTQPPTTKQILFSINGNPIPPGFYFEVEPGRVFLIPNVPPGNNAGVKIEVTGLTIPAIALPVFAGEITFFNVEVLDTQNMGSIKGKVTTEDGTTIISGASVTAMPEWGKPISATTGTDGTYEIKGLKVGTYRVQANATGYAPQFYFETDRWDLATFVNVMAQQATPDINFRLSTANTISGTVTAGGTGVASVPVNAFSQETQNGVGGQTDASGNYVLSVKPASDYKVSVNAQGYAQQFYNNRKGFNDADLVDTTKGNVTGVNFTIATGKTISGKVTQEDGTTPIQNVWVNAHSDSTGADGGGNTDLTGAYSMTVPDARDYRVNVNAPGYPQVFYGGKDQNNNAITASSWDKAVFVDTTAGNQTDINFKIGAGNTIKGTVKKSDQTALSNINVNAFSPNGWGNAQTDSNGAFTISVPPASGYRIEAFSDAYPRVMWKGTIVGGEGANDATTTMWDQATEIDTSGGSITGIDIVMSAGITVSGSVKKSDGTPVSGVWVNAQSEGTMGWGGGQTKGDGTFSFTVAPGTGYRISANHPDFPNIFYKTTDPASCATDCTEDPAGSTANIFEQATVFDFSTAGAKGVDIQFKSSGGSISGTVKASEKPISGVWMNAWSEDCKYGVGEPTKSDGKYTMKVLTGCAYKVEAFNDKYVRQFYKDKYDWMDATPVSVTTDSPAVTGIDFNLSGGNYISGKVTYGGTAVAHIWVNAQSQNTMTGGGAETDANGNYTINLKPASDYRIGVWHPDYVPQMYDKKSDWMQADPIDLSSGSKENVNFELSKGSKISGTVTTGGNAITDNKGFVNAHSDMTGSHAGVPIQSDGKYSLNVNPASDYRVEVFHPDYGRQFYNNTQRWDMATLVNTIAGEKTGIDFNLSAGREISGTITDENGAGKDGIWVNAFSDEIMSGGGEITKNGGKYSIKGLNAGTGFKVSITSNNPSESYANVFYSDTIVAGTGNWEEASKIDLTNANATNINIKLSTGGSIIGKIKSASAFTGNIFVDAFSESKRVGRGEPLKYTSGATEATFTIKGLPTAEDYRVHVMADGYGNMFYKEGTNGITDFMQATKVPVSGSAVTLPDTSYISLSAGASISGKVYHTSKADANLIRNGWVQAMNPDKGEFQGSPIKPDGTYSIKGLTADTKYTVQAMPFNYTPTFYDPTATNTSTANWVDPNVTATSSGATGIDIVVSKGYTISGRVLDENDQPVPYAFIGIFGVKDDGTGKEATPDDMDDNTFFWAPMADGAGNYRTPPLTAGKYLVGANKEGKGKGLYRKNTSEGVVAGNIEIEISSADLTDYNISFKAKVGEEPGSIAGTITNNTGSDRDELQAILYNADTGKVLGNISKKSVANGQSATYTFGKVKPGNYKMKFLGLSNSGNPPPTPSTLWYNNQASKTVATVIPVTASQAVTGIDGTLAP